MSGTSIFMLCSSATVIRPRVVRISYLYIGAIRYTKDKTFLSTDHVYKKKSERLR